MKANVIPTEETIMNLVARNASGTVYRACCPFCLLDAEFDLSTKELRGCEHLTGNIYKAFYGGATNSGVIIIEFKSETFKYAGF